MADPFHKVRPGEPLKIHAQAWNKMLDVVGNRHAIGADSTADEKASNIVLVKNTSGQPVPWLGVLEIAGVEINPSNGTLDGANAQSQAARELVRKPTLTGVMPNGNRPFGVAMEPIPVDGIGRLAIGGTFACKVKVLDASHGFARSRKNDVTQLLSAECGPMRLVWNAGQGNDKFGVVVS